VQEIRPRESRRYTCTNENQQSKGNCKKSDCTKEKEEESRDTVVEKETKGSGKEESKEEGKSKTTEIKNYTVYATKKQVIVITDET
jgi:hypothetical protein